MLVESSSHFNTTDTDESVRPCDLSHVKSNTEEYSANGACNGSTLQEHGGSKACSENGYCIACLSGDYPVALDWWANLVVPLREN